MPGGDFLGQDTLWICKLLKFDEVIEVRGYGVCRHRPFQLEIVFEVADSGFPIHCYVTTQKTQQYRGKLS